MITCRYRCDTQTKRCCFECEQTVKDKLTDKDKRCPEICSKPCFLKTGEKALKVIAQYE